MKLLLSICFTGLLICNLHADSARRTISYQHNKSILKEKIAEIAPDYIGVPYRFGGDPDSTGAADNSHLFCAIYEKAAQASGLRFMGYMPMRSLLRNTVRISSEDVRNGDLMVLKNGHAAMMYKTGPQGALHFLYASLKRQEVISFTSRNVVFEVFWLKNLRGFYRLDETAFLSDE